MKRKKQGSSLIFVVIIFTFVLTVSAGILAMVATNYSARVTENKRVENLYSSESGLDIAYNVVAKTIENANQYGYNKVEDLKTAKNISYDEFNRLDNNVDDEKDKKSLYALYADIDFLELDKEANTSKIEADKKKIDELINYVFKKNFKKYINEHLKNNIQGSDNKNDSDFGLKGMYLVNLKEKQFVDYGGALITLEDNMSEKDKLKWVLNQENEVDKQLVVKYGLDDEGKIVAKNHYNLNFTYYDKEDGEFDLKSQFKSDSKNISVAKVGVNERTIKVSYDIRVPNYDEIAFKNTVVEAPIKDIPGITIGQNMDIEDSNLNVNGDIFVQGADISGLVRENRTYKKYNSGIKLNSSKSSKSNINFNGDIYTRETFNMQNNVNINVKGDLYAKNLYAGNSENGNETTNSDFYLNNNKVVLDNDLAIKANKTNITIKDFYGISDKTENNSEKVRKSSSIIINNYNQSPEDMCKVNIKDTAYIAGVAHIDTDNDYETGESVAVKGNYNAYSVPIDKSEDYSYDDTFNNDQSLQLMNGDVNQKSRHFYEYWKDKLSGDNKVDCGGVVFDNIENVHSIGAIVSDNGNKVYNANYTIDDFKDELNKQRREYASKVYKMGAEADLGDYEGTEVKAVKVNEYIKFDNITKDDNNHNGAIFSKEKPVVLRGSYNTGENYDSNNYILVDLTSNPDLEAVIVCNKDVIIDGSVNLIGDIITNGNLIVKGNGKVNIYYDKNVTNKIQNDNKKIFKDLFGNEYAGEELGDNHSDNNINSNSTDFIKTKSWKIVK